MAAEDGNGLGSISSMLLSSSDLNLSDDVLSHEDIAWVDSCLTQDPEALERGWDSLKQVLLETLEYSAAESHDYQNGNSELDTIMITSAEESEVAKFSDTADDSDRINLFLTVKADKDSENSLIDESLGAQSSVRSPFLPSYEEFMDEELQESLTLSSGFNLGTIDNEPTGEHISKVWKLETPEKEDSDLFSPFVTDKADDEGENSADDEGENSAVDESSEAQSSVRSPFLPNYKEFLDEGVEDIVNMSSGFNSETIDNDPTDEDIFKVWELEAPEEEDEFTKELCRALAASEESSHGSSPLQSENYSGQQWGDRDEDSILGLVAGIADLSLDQDT